jgi:hypothetical protein
MLTGHFPIYGKPVLVIWNKEKLTVGFLKRLFGGGDSDAADKDGIYCYVKSDETGEVIKVRLHRYNDLSPSDDYKNYFSRKTIVGQKSYDRIEAQFNFNKNRQLIDANIAGGSLVDRENYEEYLAKQEPSSE